MKLFFFPTVFPVRPWPLLFSHFQNFRELDLKRHVILNVFQMTKKEKFSQINFCSISIVDNSLII